MTAFLSITQLQYVITLHIQLSLNNLCKLLPYKCSTIYLFLHLTIFNIFTHILLPIFTDISNKHLVRRSKIRIVLNKWE